MTYALHWRCNRCNYKNDSWKTQCAKCRCPKLEPEEGAPDGGDDERGNGEAGAIWIVKPSNGSQGVRRAAGRWAAGSGDGGTTAFSVSSTPDTGTLKTTLFDGTNVIEFQVEDKSGNTNTYTEHFTSDLDQLAGQFFSVTSSIHTVNSGADDILRLDVFVTDHALTSVSGVSAYGGSSFDLVIDLPDVIFNYPSSAFNFTSHPDFFDADARYDAGTSSITFGAFSDAAFTKNDDPILTVDVEIDDLSSILDKNGNVSMTIARMSEQAIKSSDDALGLDYTIHIGDLIITPIEQTI